MTRSQITVQSESWDRTWPECERLMELNRRESQHDRWPFQLDVNTIAAMDRARQLEIVTARTPELVGAELVGAELVGYLFWYINQILDSAALLMAQQGPFYVLSEWRDQGTALALMRHSVKRLRERRVADVYWHDRYPAGGMNLAPLFESLGAVMEERIWRMEL